MRQNAVGACIHYYFDNRRNIQFRLWEHSESHLGIPDMTLIVINISFRGPADTVHSQTPGLRPLAPAALCSSKYGAEEALYLKDVQIAR